MQHVAQPVNDEAMARNGSDELKEGLKNRRRARRKEEQPQRRQSQSIAPWDACCNALRALESVDPEQDDWWKTEYPQRLFEAASAYRSFTGGTNILDSAELSDQLIGIGRALFTIALRGASVSDLVKRCNQAFKSLEQEKDVEGYRGLLLFPQVLREQLSARWNELPVRQRRSNPKPTREALQRAFKALASMADNRELSVRDVIDLLEVDVDEERFLHSRRYVGGRAAWCLPRRSPRGRPRDAGRFTPYASWAVSDVRTAVRGWMRRLKIEPPTPS